MESPKVTEEILYEQWINHKNLKTLKTAGGEDIEILDIGMFNNDEAGPDFRNTRIRIGNFVFIGDVEIDINYADWVNHGHNINNKYNKVILHVSLFNKQNHQYVYTRDGRKVPTIILVNFLEQGIVDLFCSTYEKDNGFFHNYLRCHDSIKFISDAEKVEALSKLGIERLNKKCEKIVLRLKELTYLNSLKCNEPAVAYQMSPENVLQDINYSDLRKKEIWEQVFYELIFEALGYSKNKIPMNELAKAADLNFLKKINSDDIIQCYEAVLFNIGNLFNENLKSDSSNLSEYIKGLMKCWVKSKSFYDGKILEDIEWHFFKLRPQNFPTIRIAGGARFLDSLINKNLVEVILKKIKEIHNIEVLINSIRNLFVIKAEGYWREHYVFEKPIKSEIKYFVGAQRADEIIINVIFPFFTVYFDVFGLPYYSKKILQMYNIFKQKSDNKIISDVAKSLEMEQYLEKTILTQGMIEIFRSYCSKNRCAECKIGESIFN
ncbi:MAG: DUF2851 family protein [bacterium]